MKIWIENFINARSFKPVEPTLAIRIFDPKAAQNPKDKDGSWRNCPQAPFPSKRYKHVWCYTFDDVNYDLYPEDYALSLMSQPNYYPFTATTADDIVRRFIKHRGDVSSMMLHCHAGVSRSVAVANALDEMFELNSQWCGHAARFKDRDDGYVGNDFVYRLVCEAAERAL